MDSSLLLPLIVGCAVLLGVLSMALFFFNGLLGATQNARLRDRARGAARRGGQARNFVALADNLTARGGVLDRLVQEPDKINRLLIQAGWRSSRGPAAFFGAQMVCVLIGIVLGIATGASGFLHGGTVEKVIIVFILATWGYFTPGWLLKSRAQKRRERIASQMPLMVQVLAMLLDAGLSTRQALATLSRESSIGMPDVGAEMAVAVRQIESGADESEVMAQLSRELDVTELTTILNVLRQVDRYGGAVREPLMEAFELMEERSRLALQEYVSKMSGRMAMVMILFFFPALMMFTAGPGFMAIMQAFKHL